MNANQNPDPNQPNRKYIFKTTSLAPQQQRLSSGSNATCSPSPASAIVTTTSEAAVTSNTCTHSSHSLNIVVAASQPLSTEHYRRQLQKYCEDAAQCGGDAAKINGQLNEIFVKRLQDIDCKAEGDADLKLVTYQEWVDMLLNINEAIINNMEDLESEVAERLELVQCKVESSCRQGQGIENELAKYRKDICTLLKVVQNGYHNDTWNLNNLHFETLTHEQVLGVQCEGERALMQPACPDANAAVTQRNKLLGNMRALAVEVAGKHDEICDLKRQILDMEDEIQKAQQKIQLKDNVIKELRCDLKSANAKNTHSSPLGVNYLQSPPINLESQQGRTLSCANFLQMPPANLNSGQTSRSATTQVSDGLECNQYLNDDGSQFESLSNNECLEHQKLKVLDEELKELFEMTKRQGLEYHRKRLSDIFQKSEAEKTEAYRKLDFIRRQLIDLEATSDESSMRNMNDCDSGFSSKCENDQDAKILEAVRRRLRNFNECSFELTKRLQELEIEKDYLDTCLKTEKSISQRNSETLKEVADLLCGMTRKQFSYMDIYNSKCGVNPFCESILELKKHFQECEEELLSNLGQKENMIEELQKTLQSYEKELGQLQNNEMASTDSSHVTPPTTS